MNEDALVWNVVFTPGTFRYLRRLTESLAEHTSGRLRLVANGCPPDERDAIRDAASDRVTAYALPGQQMLTHGRALDHLFDAFDDGDAFCFVDSDVLARSAWVPPLLAALDDRAGVTSGDVSWTDDTVLPPGAEDLAGRHAIGADGFVYGSSYLALYRRAAVAGVRTRYGVTFTPYAHDRLDPTVRAVLENRGRTFRLYDTAKVLNLLLHADGGAIAHVPDPALLHLGGISQFLSNPDAPLTRAGAGVRRHDFAAWAAAVLVALADGDAPPPEPADVDEGVAAEVVAALTALFGRGPHETPRR